jgi:butyrate kinase
MTAAFVKYSSISLREINTELARASVVSPFTVEPVSDVDELDTEASRVSGLVPQTAFKT